MHLHVIGICGTFMGSLALLARARGHRVTGSDVNVYPPMSTQLAEAGITLMEGYAADNLVPAPDLTVVGNAVSRGNPEVEALLERGLAYTSGPQWLCDEVLTGRPVIAIAGTHGKTTTATMTAWILECAGLAPGYLIGGVPPQLGDSARIGDPRAPFVVEADEYDTAFFDKRSKFVHYRPRIAVLNNLEFDHADIFPDLAAIERQFHHLVRTVPAGGKLVVAADAVAGAEALERVLDQGCWTPVARFGDESGIENAGGDWRYRLISADGSHFALAPPVDDSGETDRFVECQWAMRGRHNVANACAAVAAAVECGVSLAVALEALARFAPPRRRQELRGEVAGVKVIDDFAHHPTAIATTLEGLAPGVAAEGQGGRLWAVIEPRSNTMKLGTMKARLPASVTAADRVSWFAGPSLGWSLEETVSECRALGVEAEVEQDLDTLIAKIANQSRAGDWVVVMSNGGFGGIHERLLAALAAREGEA
ncbi:UDP-N-acetylmuramate:L-alanyl-gamma-D-glutamyl-meso-diaminopimelate ligase [Cobetia amphilecti]|uniref:UDP-N-acetylmuramate--L-alanyl-gamma-D-glutamyl-meso-2,6-diaminoheptandioate ligase n=1 Tax=Cobetia amphilecti TaxID=1055104 RepID=A0AAP4U1N6_9GAMM|nr:UDP-N-acetylmuramate:L-alanyl-gamma-D-glutamyl-meso-diaminopimelate ligase [Cobetia amphilecti]MDO6672423.1 UDP-N-acetylmuramate:L-alanyl-gamma-D-glutamyl-meso-diaminopimelate ligase [Cobetia amphilecti]